MVLDRLKGGIDASRHLTAIFFDANDSIFAIVVAQAELAVLAATTGLRSCSSFGSVDRAGHLLLRAQMQVEGDLPHH